jgi:hypothetical protein
MNKNSTDLYWLRILQILTDFLKVWCGAGYKGNGNRIGVGGKGKFGRHNNLVTILCYLDKDTINQFVLAISIGF